MESIFLSWVFWHCSLALCFSEITVWFLRYLCQGHNSWHPETCLGLPQCLTIRLRSVPSEPSVPCCSGVGDSASRWAGGSPVPLPTPGHRLLIPLLAANRTWPMRSMFLPEYFTVLGLECNSTQPPRPALLVCSSLYLLTEVLPVWHRGVFRTWVMPCYIFRKPFFRFLYTSSHTSFLLWNHQCWLHVRRIQALFRKQRCFAPTQQLN